MAKPDPLDGWQEECDALKAVVEALKPLTDDERSRILTYAWDRFVVNPSPVVPGPPLKDRPDA